jgi:hypothetical protein
MHNLADLAEVLKPLYEIITPAFIALTLWRMAAVERSLEKLNKLLMQHLLDEHNREDD